MLLDEGLGVLLEEGVGVLLDEGLGVELEVGAGAEVVGFGASEEAGEDSPPQLARPRTATADKMLMIFVCFIWFPF